MDNRQQMYSRYNNRCRQPSRCSNAVSPSRVDRKCGYHVEEDRIDKCINKLPLAMAYVPMQRWENVCDAPSGLAQGSIFKDLVKPYCPVLQRRGNR